MAKPNKGGRPKYKKKQKEQPTPKSSVEQAPTKYPASSQGANNAGQIAEQARAGYALTALSSVLEETKDEQTFKHSELKSYIRRLPGMIQMNGFGQTIAFYYAKGQAGSSRNAYSVVYGIIENWLCEGQQIYADTGKGSHRLLTAITENDQQDYRAAQAETHALMRWLKKFAEALIIKNADDQ